ncbi:MAG TPA: hypothetical protein VLF39_00510 [Candidatus Saccharimonadales bacterium]|nr:hypothetical protein [Candidatus Saccharimonadales bacterium]
MNQDKLLSSYFFESSEPNGELVSYAAGYNSKIKTYNHAVKTLNNMGYDVLAFDYDPAVLQAGQPQYLLDVVDRAVEQVKDKSKDYQETVSMGVSLGGFIGYNVLKRIGSSSVGAFADCGVDFVPAIFNSGTLDDVAKAYQNNGYDQASLNRIWEPLDVEPSKATFPKDKSFIVFDGTRDKLIDFNEAKQNIEDWAAKGINVKQYPLKGLGHLLTGAYFVRHTKKIIGMAKEFHAQIG